MNRLKILDLALVVVLVFAAACVVGWGLQVAL